MYDFLLGKAVSMLSHFSGFGGAQVHVPVAQGFHCGTSTQAFTHRVWQVHGKQWASQKSAVAQAATQMDQLTQDPVQPLFDDDREGIEEGVGTAYPQEHEDAGRFHWGLLCKILPGCSPGP